MAAPVKVTVLPSSTHPDILDVRDAMRQVDDFFALLGNDEWDDPIVWNLVSATTNSPFTAEGTPVSREVGVDVSTIIREREVEAAEIVVALTQGRRPERLSKTKQEAARRLFYRNQNGVGLTKVAYGDHVIATVTPASAKLATRTLETVLPNVAMDLLLVGSRARDELGSVEGILVDVGTDYNQPAIRIRERKTGREIWCRVDDSLKGKIASEASFEDVWDHRRVIVRGLVRYDDDGAIMRVHARSVEPVEARQMTPEDIRDPDFTGGLSTAEYLDKLRENGFGH